MNDIYHNIKVESKTKINFLFFLLIIFISCQNKEETERHSSLLLHEIKPVYETTLINEMNHDPKIEGFGHIIHLEMTNLGDFFILDVMGNKIHVFDINGNERFIFQESGKGPGEFLSLNLVYDENLGLTGIYDPILERLTVMDNNLKIVIKSQSVRKKLDNQLELIGLTDQGVFYKGFEGFTLYNYKNPRLLNVYFQSFEIEEPKLIFSVPMTEWHPTVNHEQGFISADYKPMGRRVSLNKHGDQFIYISNDGLGYTLYDFTGTIVHSDSSFPHNTHPYKFNEEQIEQYLETMFTPGTDKDVKAEILKELRSVMNPHRPLWFRNSFVDVQGRLWFELYPELFDDESRWIVWDVNDETVFQVLFNESNIRPQNAVDDTIVVFKRNEFDLETVRIYTFLKE